MNNLISNLAKYSKYVFAVVMLVFGLFHFISGDAMAEMVPIPGGVIWIYLTGAALIAAAVAVFINKYMRLAMFLLGVMLLLFVILIHIPGAADGNEASVPMVLKDLGLMAAAWILAGNSEDNKF
jgi:cadmium resistance protein CadD (predicted permease)